MRPAQEFFKHVKTGSKRAPTLLQKIVSCLESDQYALPKTFDIMTRFRPEELKLKDAGRALRLRLPENELIKEFYERYPEAKLEPVNLQSFQAPVAKKFAALQLSYMQQSGRPYSKAEAQAAKEAAFQEAEKTLAQDIRALRRRGALAFAEVRLVQEEEEQQLRSALEEVAARRTTAGR